MSSRISLPHNLVRFTCAVAEIRSASLDFGRIHIAKPAGVQLPRSADDIAALILWAAPRGIPVGARGRGHNGSGYAQAGGGIVVDTRTLSRVHRVTSRSVDTDTGCDWDAVLAQTIPRGLRPPVLPSHQRLSVGGVLAVGGLGEASFKFGTAGGAVMEFELVTGTGDILRCSRRSHPELFRACLGGFGQFGIMTRVKMGLTRIPPRQRLARLLYADPAAYAADFARLMDRADRVEGLMGSAIPNTRAWLDRVMGPASRTIWLRREEYPWLMVLEVRYRPEHEEALGPLDHLPAARYVQDRSGFIDFEPVPSNPAAHNIWLHLMLPIEKSARFLAHVFRTLDVDPETDGPITVYPIVPARLPDTLFRAPEAAKVLLFDLMPVIARSNPARLRRVFDCLADANRVARRLGGMCYPVGGLRYTRADWKRHFGTRWNELAALKKRYDPLFILGPGPGIFHSSDVRVGESSGHSR